MCARFHCAHNKYSTLDQSDLLYEQKGQIALVNITVTEPKMEGSQKHYEAKKVNKNYILPST